MIDHIVWYAEELEWGIDHFQELSGVRAIKGGAHSGLGTHNALLALGTRCYLEILAPDPKQTGGAWQECLRRAGHPGLFHWAVAVPNLEALAASPPDDLLRGRKVFGASRENRRLGELRWKLLMLEVDPFGAQLPFLIDWGSSPHPAQAAPSGCSLKSIQVYSPDKARLDAFFAALDLDITVKRHNDPQFSVRLETPRGLLVLDSIKPLPSGLAC